jgi:hypothetical protein
VRKRSEHEKEKMVELFKISKLYQGIIVNSKKGIGSYQKAI